MVQPSTIAQGELLASADQRVFMRNVPWSHYEVMLALRGEAAVPRMTYLEGVLELMSPSRGHETTKETVGRLLEAYADEVRIDLWSHGSWTLKNALKERGAEPDKCYGVGRASPEAGVPDLAIEVAWTRGGIDKLEVYRGLGVHEVWFWEDGAILVFLLQDGRYERAPRSAAFPELDLGLVGRLATHENPSQAVRELRASARERRA